MNSNTVGILIILGIIVIGLSTGGDIFRQGNALNTTTTPREAALQNRNNPNNNYSDTYSVDGEIHNSPYSGKVIISGIRNPGTFTEYINLSVNLNDGESVLITGWRLRSRVTGSVVPIGGAANIPFEGTRTNDYIMLNQDAKIVVSPSKSPINTSFRINKCAGFFEEKKNFQPGVWTSCPEIRDDAPLLSRGIDDDCLDYIQNLPSCEIPNDRDFPEYISNACENFLETKVNYGSCVANHIGDEDFFENEWRLYAGLNGIFWREKRDTIELLDNSNRVVDVYSY